MSSSAAIPSALFRLDESGEREMQQLWEAFAGRLRRVVRRRLKTAPRRDFDEDDVAQSAFISFWQGVRGQKFPDLETRRDVWKLLLVIVQRKSIDYLQRRHRQKRGGGRVRGESAVDVPTSDGAIAGMGAIEGDDFTPAFNVEIEDEFDRLFDALADQTLQRIAAWKLDGFTNEEIAEMVPCARATVARKLARIRKIWRDCV